MSYRMVPRKGRRRNPPPGFYPDVPSAEYFSWPSLDNTRLKPARKSAEHFQLAESEPKKESTSAQDFGTLVHSLLLTADTWDRYVIEPDFAQQMFEERGWNTPRPTATEEYKGRRETFAAEHKGQIIITQELADRAVFCAAKAREHVGNAWKGAAFELSAVAACPETGYRLKARFDILKPGKFIEDYKTTANGGTAFHAEVFKWGYAYQAAMYQDIVEFLTGDRLPFYITASENSPPYLTRRAPLNQDLIDAARCELVPAIRRAVALLERGVLDGFPHITCWGSTAVAVKIGDEIMEVE